VVRAPAFVCVLGLGLVLVPVFVGGCRGEPEPVRVDPRATTPTQIELEPEVALIPYACQGFEAAVANAAPRTQMLAHTARHAIELGGPPVEQASVRWALLPPPALLELIDRYEHATQADPHECAGLRAHLEVMSRHLR
jgi:hypothetical protein